MGLKSLCNRIAVTVGVAAAALSLAISPMAAMAAGEGLGTVAKVEVSSEKTTAAPPNDAPLDIVVENDKVGSTGTNYVITETIPEDLTITKKPQDLWDKVGQMTFKKADGSTIAEGTLFNEGGMVVTEYADLVRTIEYRIPSLAHGEQSFITVFLMVKSDAHKGEVVHNVTYSADDSAGGSVNGAATASLFITDLSSVECSKGGQHEPDDGTVTTPATCHSLGVRTIKCTKCQEVLGTQSIPMTPHSFVREDGLNDPSVQFCSECHFPNPDYKGSEPVAAAAEVVLDPSVWIDVEKGDVKTFTATIRNVAAAEIDGMTFSIDTLPEGLILTPGSDQTKASGTNVEGVSLTMENSARGSVRFTGKVDKMHYEGQEGTGQDGLPATWNANGIATITFSVTCTEVPTDPTAKITFRASAPLVSEMTKEVGVSFASKPTKPDTPAHTEHTWGEWVEDPKATCTTAGLKTRKCTYTGCNQTQSEPVAALGHDYDPKTHRCTRCGVEEAHGTDTPDPVANMSVELTPAKVAKERGDKQIYTAIIKQTTDGAETGAVTIEGKLSSGLRFVPDTDVRLGDVTQPLDASMISVRTDGFTISLPTWNNGDEAEVTFQVTSSDSGAGTQTVTLTASPEKGAKGVASATYELPGENTTGDPGTGKPFVTVTMAPGVIDDVKPGTTTTMDCTVANTVANTITGRVTLTCELPSGLSVVKDTVRITGVPQSVSSVVETTLHGFAVTLSNLPYGNRIGLTFDVTVDDGTVTGDYVAKVSASPEKGTSSPAQSTFRVVNTAVTVPGTDDPGTGSGTGTGTGSGTGSGTGGGTGTGVSELKLVAQPATATLTEGELNSEATFTVKLTNSGATLDRDSVLRFDCAKGIHVKDIKVVESTDEYPGSVMSDFSYKMPKLLSGTQVDGTYVVTLDATTHIKKETTYPITISLLDGDGKPLIDPMKLTVNVLPPVDDDDDVTDPTDENKDGTTTTDENGDGTTGGADTNTSGGGNGGTDGGSDQGGSGTTTTGGGNGTTTGGGTSGSTTSGGTTKYYASNGSTPTTVTSKVASKMPQTGNAAVPVALASMALCGVGAMVIGLAVSKHRSDPEDAR